MPAVTEQVVRVLIGERSRIEGELLSHALRGKRIVVIETTTTTRQTIEFVKHNGVNVALISLELEDSPIGGLIVLRAFRALNRAPRFILLVDGITDDILVSAFRNGARGIFSRRDPVCSLRKCIMVVNVGQVWARAEHMSAVLAAFQSPAPLRVLSSTGHELLTGREQELLPLVGEGCTNREIADKLNVSEHTVKNHLFRIYEKLGISSRVELILYATTGGSLVIPSTLDASDSHLRSLSTATNHG